MGLVHVQVDFFLPVFNNVPGHDNVCVVELQAAFELCQGRAPHFELLCGI